jgi:hypothetical protein
VAQRAAGGTELWAAEYVQQYLAQHALDDVGPFRARALRRVGASVRVRTEGVRTRLLQRRLSPRHAAARAVHRWQWPHVRAAVWRRAVQTAAAVLDRSFEAPAR